MKKRPKKHEYIAYVYLAVLFLGVSVLFAFPSLHREVLVHPQDMTEKEIRDKKEITIISNGIVGTWQSEDDSRYQREFTPNEVIEWYDGKEVSRDPYTLFEGTSVPLELVPSPEPYLVYVLIGTANDNPIMLSINTYSQTRLDMFNLSRGNMLRYTRI